MALAKVFYQSELNQDMRTTTTGITIRGLYRNEGLHGCGRSWANEVLEGEIRG